MSQSEVLHIDTKGICILCYKCVDINIGKENPEKLSSSSSQGFKMLLRYLNVNPRELFNCSEDFLQSMDMSVKIDLQINLCSDCSLVTQTFHQLYKDYELIQLQFDDCIRSIHKSIEAGDICSERVQEYKRKMQPYLLTQLVNASIATNLRKEMLNKCAAKLESATSHESLPNRQSLLNADLTPHHDNSQPGVLTSTGNQESKKADTFNPNITEIKIQDVEDILCTADQEITNYFNDDCLPYSLPIPINSEVEHTPRNITLSPSKSNSHRSLKVKRKYICEICKTHFGKSELLSRHRATVHMGYLIHKHSPLKSSLWTEENCSEAAKDCIDEIVKRNHLEGEPNYKCCYCSKILAKRECLKRHLVSTHIEKFYDQIRSNLQISKSTCESVTTAPSSSAGHTSDIKKCQICKKSFDSLQLLLKHRRLRHSQNQGPTEDIALLQSKKDECPHCQVEFKTSASFKLHMKINHTLESVLEMLPPNTSEDECQIAIDSVLEWISKIWTKCPHCDFTFHRLKRHMLEEHFEELVDQVQALLKSIDTNEDEENLQAPRFQTQEDIIEIEDEDTEIKMEVEIHNDTDPLA